jgi:hypothetical protein
MDLMSLLGGGGGGALPNFTGGSAGPSQTGPVTFGAVNIGSSNKWLPWVLVGVAGLAAVLFFIFRKK